MAVPKTSVYLSCRLELCAVLCFGEELAILTLVETQAFVIFSQGRHKWWENGEVRSAPCTGKKQELFICLLSA